MPVDLVVSTPSEDRVRGEFCPVVADNHAGLASAFDDGGEFPRHPMCPEIDVSGMAAEALMGDVIGDIQDPEPSGHWPSGHARSPVTNGHWA